jgi:serine/threonine protein kinase
MGEVYRACDSKLKREVAVKVLPEAFSRDADRVARFQREAEVLAALNHSYIAQIYGLEESAGTRCIVLEFVDGETLQERIGRGPVPVDEALEIARQILEALEAAHEKGIVHRDLKPANIKITTAGHVKVLDFGLAKAANTNGSSDISQSPTMLSDGTVQGALLGTAAYMSPEQANGKVADSRSDLWAFGAVFFELLTGMAVFSGDSMIETLGNVLKSEPDWTALPAETPAEVRNLLRRCLQKDRRRRLHCAADARLQIDDVLSGLPADFVIRQKRFLPDRRRFLWLAAAPVAAVAASVSTVFYMSRSAARPPESRLQIVTPPGNDFYFAISPDGRSVVYQATTQGKSQLWLRQMDSETPRPLAGTENPLYPFWSFDSRSIGFFSDQKLKRLDLSGGAPRILADAPTPRGGTWNAENIILFAPGGNGPLFSVPATGEHAPEAVTRVDSPKQTSHRFPHFMLDGKHFLLFATGTSEGRGVYAGSLDSKDTYRLLDADTAAGFVPPNQILFVRQQSLMAQRLDLSKLQVIGEPVLVAERVSADSATGVPSVSTSSSAHIGYRIAVDEPRQLKWFDRSGNPTGVIGEPDNAQLSFARLSFDERMVAFSRTVDGNPNIWVMDAKRGAPQRLTIHTSRNTNPIWSPDSGRIVFESNRNGRLDLFVKRLAGGDEELLLKSSESKNPYDWSADGRFILYSSQSAKTGRDLWALPIDTNGKPGVPIVVTQSAFEEANGRFSGDGHWVAFQSDETGRPEIYIQPFPVPGPKTPVTTGGGTSPHWSRDGRELYFVAPDRGIMAVTITYPSNGSHVQVGRPFPLFTPRIGSQLFEPAPDGQHFLITTPLADAPTPPITIIQNWAGGSSSS